MQWTEQEAAETGDAIGIDWETVDFTPADLAAGMDVETEHGSRHEPSDVGGDDPEIAAKIAWAHLLESPRYYEYLAEMEAMMKQEAQTTKEAAAAPTIDYEAAMNPSNWTVDSGADVETDVAPRFNSRRLEFDFVDQETGLIMGSTELTGHFDGQDVRVTALWEGGCDDDSFDVQDVQIETLEPPDLHVSFEGTAEPFGEFVHEILSEVGAFDDADRMCGR